MASNLGWFLGVIFVASAAFFLISQKGKRDIVLDRLHLSRRRVSGAKTPPRSLSPSKKQVQGLEEPNYADTFPPSRRSALNGLTSDLSDDEPVEEPSEEWKKSIVPMKTSYLDADENMYMPCGFSVKEIKALGDFPDYATLSGVPLPKPYHDFDISKALPRPYRPFRWAYHQTMCKSSTSSRLDMILTTTSTHQNGTRLVARSRKHLRLPHP
jgi:hypothetical protein